MQAVVEIDNTAEEEAKTKPGLNKQTARANYCTLTLLTFPSRLLLHIYLSLCRKDSWGKRSLFQMLFAFFSLGIILPNQI